MKKYLSLIIAFLAVAVLAGCSATTTTEKTTAAESTTAAEVTTTEAPASTTAEEQSTTTNEAKKTATLSGSVDFYGMFSVTVTLELYDDGTVNEILDYGENGKASVSTTYAVENNALYINYISVDADNNTSVVKTEVVADGNGFYACTVPTTLGNVIVSSEAYISTMTGSIDFYGMFSLTVSVDMYANGKAVETLDYGDNGKACVPTTYTTAEDGTVTLNYYYIDADGNATVVPTALLTNGVKFFNATVKTTLGDVEITTDKLVKSMSGSVEFYGFSLTVTIDLYENDIAIETLDYGENGKGVVPTTYTAAEDGTITFNYYNVGTDGSTTVVPTAITVDEAGDYSCKVSSNLGEVSLTSKVETPVSSDGEAPVTSGGEAPVSSDGQATVTSDGQAA